MLLRIPFRLGDTCMHELEPLELPWWNLTILFGRETSKKWLKIVRDFPTDVDARIFLAELLYVEKRFEQSLHQLQQALAFLPSDEEPGTSRETGENHRAKIHYEMGNALLASGKLQEARSEWETARALDNDIVARLARRRLIEHPIDGLKHYYKLIVVKSKDVIDREEFADYETVWPIYETWKLAVRPIPSPKCAEGKLTKK